MMRRKSQVGLGVSLSVVTAAAVLYYWSQQPVEGKVFTTISQPTASVQPDRDESMKLAPSEQTMPKAWQTKYFSSLRPAGLDVRSSQEDASGAASYVLYGGAVGQASQLAVSLYQLAGPLSEVAAIKLRQSQPETYKPLNLAYAQDSAIAFEREDDYELSLFWQHEGRYASVVASGSSQQRMELNQLMKTVVTNWRWR